MMRFRMMAVGLVSMLATVAHAQFSYPGCSDLASSDFQKTELLSRTGANGAALNSNLREPTYFDLQPVYSGGALSHVNIFFVERLGSVKFYDGLAKTVTLIGTISTSAGVTHPSSQSDNGLMGIALDPGFNLNRWLYVWYIPPRVGTNNYRGRLSRFTVTAQNALDLNSERILIDTKLSKSFQWHSGGPMQFDSYGDLWVTLGNNSADLQISSPYKQFSRTDSTQSEEWGPSSTSTLRGGVFRIHPDDAAPKGYTIPSGNFGEYWAQQFQAQGNLALAAEYRDTNKVLPEIYVKGERSNHSIAVHPTKRWLAYGTVNYDVNLDEINIVSHPAFMGYPYFHANQLRTPGQQEILGYLQDTLAPRNESPFNSGVVTLPPAQRPAASFSDGIVPNVSIGGPIYVYDRTLKSTVKFPPHLHEKWLAFSELGGEAYFHTIDPVTVTLAGTQRVDAGSGRLFTGVGALRNALQAKYGPEGALYFLFYGGGQYVASPANNPGIVRVDYVGDCHIDNLSVRYPVRAASYVQGTAIALNTPVLNPELGSPLGFVVNKSLPAGLTLHATTGVISGTPLSTAVSDSYVVTATFPDTIASDTVTILVNPMAPSALTYSQPVASYEAGSPITPNTPALTGAATRFTVSPALPNGLQLDSVTGVISGTPLSTSFAANYTITASNVTGSTAAVVNVTVSGGVVFDPYASWSQTKTFGLNTTAGGAGVASGVGRVPVLVRLTAAHAAIFAGAKAGGADIRFSKPDGTALDYEIESWNTAGQSAAVWVLLDTVVASGVTPVRLHYGNAAATSESNGSRVFTAANGYRAVWHLSEASGNVTDATSNAIVGTDTGTTTTTGVSGPARNFAGANAANNTLTNAQFINVGNPVALNIGGNITMESWVRWNRIRPTTGSSFYRTVMQRNGTGNTAEMFLRINNASPYLYQSGKYTGSADVLAASPSGPVAYGDSLQWVHLAGVYDSVSTTNKVWRLYRNGVQLAASSPTTAVGPAATATGWSIGRFHNSTTSHRYWSGDLDEIRVSAVPRSAAFLRLGYKNQKPGTYPITDLAYLDPAPTYGVGKVIPSNTASLLGTASRYTAIGLPAGLALNVSTGAITGTPTVAGSYSVGVTAWSDSSWSAGVIVPVTVVAAPEIAYTTPQEWIVGAAVAPLSPASSGGPVASYAALDVLPAGMTVNTATGVISGTPVSAVASAGYRLAAANAAGADTFAIRIVVNEPAPVIAYATPAAYTIGTAIATLAPVSTGGPVTGYQALDALPSGLSLNPANGAITGTPAAYADSAYYRIRAQGPGGSDTAAIRMFVNHHPLYIPRANLLARGPAVFAQRCSGCHGADGSGAPGGTGARPPLAYSDWFMAIRLRPASVLMHGVTGSLTVNGQVYTGSMSNRASMSNEDIASVLTYLRVVLNDSLVASCDADNRTPEGYSTCAKTARSPSELASDSIAVWEIANIRTPPAAPANLAYPVQAAFFPRHVAIAPITPTVDGFVFQYAVNPELPAGLHFNPNTGSITGTPLSASPSTVYVVTAQNGSGSATDTLTLAVSALPGPPTAVLARAGNGKAFLTWMAPNDDGGWPVTGYAATASPGGAQCAGVTDRSCTLTGLSNGTAYTFTVQASNAQGAGAASAPSSAVTPGPAPDITYAGGPFRFDMGSTVNQPATNTGTPGVSWSIEPNLNALTGLLINPGTGRIVGTPVYLSSARDYVVTAVDAAGRMERTVVNIAASAVPPSISYPTPHTFVTGTPIAGIAPVNTAGSISTWSIAPNLNAVTGLVFSPVTGRIGGTPVYASPATDYTVTAQGFGGTSATAVIRIATVAPAPTVTYDHTPRDYPVGVTITPLTKTAATGSISGYTIAPALPAGLQFSTSTGAILGTPTVATPATLYVVTAAGPGGTGRDSVNIRTSTAAPTVSYAHTLWSYVVGVEIATLTKTAATGIISGYSVAPSLPAGLLFNPSTGAILGTPTAAVAAKTYTVTATGPGGTGSDTVRIETVTPAPTLTYDDAPLSFPVGVAIPTISRTGATGLISGYMISPALPAGLLFNTTNGRITGTPVAAVPAAFYRIVATGPGGSGGDSVNLATTLNPPVLAFSSNPYSFVKGAEILAFRPNNTGGPITGWSIGNGSNGSSLTANTGLMFNPTTGKILGTPVYLSPARAYVVTANGLSGASDTETVSIAVTLVAKAGEAGSPGESFSFRVSGGAMVYRLSMPQIDGATENVTVTLSDLSGRPVWSRSLDPRTGARELIWDGRDRLGRRVAAGMYMVRVAATGSGKTATVTGKAVRLER